MCILPYYVFILILTNNCLNELVGVRGGARTGYLIPGCDGMGAWTRPEIIPPPPSPSPPSLDPKLMMFDQKQQKSISKKTMSFFGGKKTAGALLHKKALKNTKISKIHLQKNINATLEAEKKPLRGRCHEHRACKIHNKKTIKIVSKHQ